MKQSYYGGTLNEIMNKLTRKHNLLPKQFTGTNPGEIISNPHEILKKHSMNTYLIDVKTAFLLNQSLNSRLKLR